VLLNDVVAVSAAVAATRSHKEKTRLIADLLARTEPGQRELVACYLSGRLRQRRTGLGWRGLQTLPPPAAEPSLQADEVDAAFERLGSLAGPGSVATRSAAVAELFGRATQAEQQWLRAVALGNVRQGALERPASRWPRYAGRRCWPAARRTSSTRPSPAPRHWPGSA
jgi:DNA ligase-1